MAANPMESRAIKSIHLEPQPEVSAAPEWPSPKFRSVARATAFAVLALNFAMLALSLGDWRVSIDSGYHVSLAEWYARHGAAWWDHINYGPRGRPNLQGPALHMAIAVLGLLMGGKPHNFIFANALLALAQWTAAMATVWYFTRRYGDEIAAMLAVVLVAGAAFASASFYVGIPSGWVFIAAPWAIYFFLRDRWIVAALIVTLGCYTHLGGFAVLPFGVLIAAAMERRWRRLIAVGIVSAVLTAPFSLHFLANLSWYRGVHAIEALHFDPMLDLLALAGVAWMLVRRRGNTFLVAWVFAPAAWLFQDPYRFVLQEALAGGAVAGLMLRDVVSGLRGDRARAALVLGIAAAATIFPLGPPSLAGEISWALGYRAPRMLNWDRARTLAQVIERNGLEHRLVTVYENSLGSALAVFAPIQVERGHWVEVHALNDPADDLPAEVKVYVVPLSARSEWLHNLERQGLVHDWGGTGETAVVTLAAPPPTPAAAAELFARVISTNAQWLSRHSERHSLLHEDFFQLPRFYSEAEIQQWIAQARVQRFHAGRMEVATLLYSYSLEDERPRDAKALRMAALGFGEVASFLSDGDTIGDESAREHARFRAHMAALAVAVRAHPRDPIASREVREAAVALFQHYFHQEYPRAELFAESAAPSPASRVRFGDGAQSRAHARSPAKDH